MTPFFFMCSTIGCAITAKPCGRRNSHFSCSGGTPTGEIAICVVLASNAIGATATDTVVIEPPKIMSTLSSVTKRRALLAPLLGSDASSRMIRLTFSPPMVCGHSLNWLPTGMPRPEAGPVSDSVTPMLTSANAGPATATTAATTSVFNEVFRVFFMERLLVGSGESEGVQLNCKVP